MKPDGWDGIEDTGIKPEGAGVGIGMKPDDEGGRLYLEVREERG